MTSNQQAATPRAKALLADLRAIVGDAHVQHPDSAQDWPQHQLDWRQRYQGWALAIVRPASTAEVAAVVVACAKHGTSIVPQGGNTSLVGGSVPDASGHQVVLHLGRLKAVLNVDAANLSITVQAGCLLADVQRAAEEAGLLFPLSLASEGSCTIGGNLASNAGGTQVLRYGTARELCLGIEAVTAQGEVWDGLQGLRKDNTGYDLRDLLIGSEGTLAIITAATLKLYPRPRGVATALLACPDMAAAVHLLQAARETLDAGLTAFEAMAELPLQLVFKHQPEVAKVLMPLQASPAAHVAAGTSPGAACGELALPPWVVLVEACSSESDPHAQSRLQSLLAEAMARGSVLNAALASQARQREAMWLLRETIPLAERREGLMVKHDIGVPASALPAFVAEAQAAIAQRWPQARVVCFGHLGDGNLHYNVQPPPEHAGKEGLPAFEHAINQVVFDLVHKHRGTISAEHGIGTLRQAELVRRKSPVAMAMMRAIKQALDPSGLLNPGRVLSSRDDGAPSGP